MALIAGQVGRERVPMEWRSVISAAGLGMIGCGLRNPPPHRDVIAATALAAAGLAALVALPFLIITSLALGAPFAAPAAIALGYLGIAHAMASRQPRRAAAWSFGVFFGLAGWAFLLALTSGVPRSAPGLAALLMAPLFAAAPALVRSLLSPSSGRVSGGSQREAPAGGSAEANAPQPIATYAAAHPAVLRQTAANTAQAVAPLQVTASRCDMQEAISFALQRVGPKAKAGGIALICEGESDVAVACDRALCRRIVLAILDNALARSRPGDAVAVAARNLRGAVLLRVSLSSARETVADALALRQSPEFLTLAAIIDDAGGTIIFDGAAAGATISIRLASAADWVAERRHGKHAQAA